MTDDRSREPSTGSAEAHLEWSALAVHLHGRLSSPAAKDRLCTSGGDPDTAALLTRSRDVHVVRDQLRALDGIEAALRCAADLESRVSVSAELMAVADIKDILQRAHKGTALDVGELCAVADLVTAADRISTMFRELDHDVLSSLPVAAREAVDAVRGKLASMTPPRGLPETLERSLDRGGEPRLADTASEVLGRLRGREKQARRSLVNAAEKFLKRQSNRHALADNYWTERDGRVVVPVRSDGFSRVGGQGTVSGIIHGASGSGQTLFVEPGELVDVNNAVREATTAVRTEERRILLALSKRVGASASELTTGLDALVLLDTWHARLRLCRDLGATVPDVVEARPGSRLELPQARHPLMVLAGTDVVPNDLAVDVGGALVISGPNAGGKTVALKTIGMCVLMAQAGLRIPADGRPVVPLFSSVVTDVGDDQSISANLSTFSAHIGHVLEAFEACEGPQARPLVLLDEVAVGTDPDQGAALAEAILRALVDAGATQVVTTHYERLKLLATDQPERFRNAAVGFDIDNLRPTFRVRVGAPGSSSALAVAQRLGVPAAVLQRAEALLADAQVRVDALLREVEAERERLATLRDQLETDRKKLDAERAALQQREKRAEESASVRHKKAFDAATSALRSLEDEIKARRKRLKKRDGVVVDASGVSDPADRRFARDLKGRIDDHRPASDSPGGDSPPPESVEVGDEVQVVALGSTGEVVSVKGDKITVAVGAIKTTVSVEALRPSKAQKRPKARSKPDPRAVRGPSPGRFFGSDAQAVDEGIDNVLDIRGMRADEAVTMLEVFLDRSISDDREVVIVRHGYGSGALRRVIREHLPRLGHVHRHRRGLPSEGGDAVTVVWVAM